MSTTTNLPIILYTPTALCGGLLVGGEASQLRQIKATPPQNAVASLRALLENDLLTTFYDKKLAD